MSSGVGGGALRPFKPPTTSLSDFLPASGDDGSMANVPWQGGGVGGSMDLLSSFGVGSGVGGAAGGSTLLTVYQGGGQ